MNKKYVVRLDSEERAELLGLIAAGSAAARTQAHARILLKADQGIDGPGWADAAIAEAIEVHRATVERVRERLVTEGLDAALRPRRPAPRPRKLDGAAEAHLVALACSEPPGGRARWTLRLLADELVALDVVEAIAPETVRAALKKTTSSRGGSGSGASRPATTPHSWPGWRTCSTSTTAPPIPAGRWSASTRRASN